MELENSGDFRGRSQFGEKGGVKLSKLSGTVIFDISC